MALLKLLPGQEVTEGDYAHLLAEVDALLWRLIYGPIVDLVRPSLPRAVSAGLAPRSMHAITREELLNAAEAEGEAALRKALREGTVQMVPDPQRKLAQFAVVKPDRRISDGLKSFGARLNKTTDLWTCAPDQVPAWVRFEAQSYASIAGATHDAVAAMLDDLEGKVDAAIAESSLAKGADHAVAEVAKGWKESAKSLEVMPDLGAAGHAALAQAFAEKAKIPIKKLALEQIARLREEVDANAAQGYRAAGLAERIRNEYAVSKGRADLIARQETNNFMSAYRMARALDAGLKRYMWRTTRDLRARFGHREINGLIFSYIAKAPARYMSSGVPCNPGQDFRCLTADARINLAYGVEKLFRRPYSGEITTVVMDDGEVLRATPNHPVLTSAGWRPIGALHEGDQLVELRQEGILLENDTDKGVPTIGEIFEAFREACLVLHGHGRREQFHGDGSDGEVDIVDAARFLRIDGKATLQERFGKFLLSEADLLGPGSGELPAHHAPEGFPLGLHGGVTGSRERAPLLGRHAGEAQQVRLGAVAGRNADIEESPAHYGPAYPEAARDGQLALAGRVGGNHGGVIHPPSVPVGEAGVSVPGDERAAFAQLFREVVSREADALGDLFNEQPIVQKAARTVKLIRSDRFEGHVFNLQTKHGWYTSGNIIHKNCRCMDRTIIE